MHTRVTRRPTKGFTEIPPNSRLTPIPPISPDAYPSRRPDTLVGVTGLTQGVPPKAQGANVNDVTDGGTVDLVVLDNLIYGEPKKAL